jgi:hypothetical protein
MYRLAPLSTRNQLPRFLVDKGLRGNAVEIGTHRGEYAQIIMQNWPGILSCIDPWDNLPGYEDQAVALPSRGRNRQDDYEHTKQLLREYQSRVLLMRSTSKEAVRQFGDGTLDFVYVDGDHKKVYQDLSLWYPKLRSGGIIACHDWMCPGEPEETNWARWVQPAVQEFATQEGLDIWLIVEEGGLPFTAYMVRK